ncbi:hypothetical protein B0T25DRAFT_555259 [Lasiosphaeria hispida]|uniref:Uncharacterized protein n=1 Tax=Lasiosphaeria hispida TaxID=260671 RepID=A0AAJ0H8L9_9PEZI|nr:hypothetical protein B0T25DRAFT_555259 [Lasiosphaeria hispida]
MLLLSVFSASGLFLGWVRGVLVWFGCVGACGQVEAGVGWTGCQVPGKLFWVPGRLGFAVISHRMDCDGRTEA